MSRINDEFMESFKRLDKICKEIFRAEKGVTSYIDAMENIYNGFRYVPNWDVTIERLKKLRHIRNNHAHEVGTSDEDICTPGDIRWLNDFYDSILNTSDPLALYRQATAPKPGVVKKEQPQREEFPTIRSSSHDNSEAKGGCLSIFVAVFVVAAIILGSIGIYLFYSFSAYEVILAHPIITISVAQLRGIY